MNPPKGVEHKCGSWLVFLKKAQVRRRTVSCPEGWMPEASRRVRKSSVVMPRAESRKRSEVRWEWSRKCSMISGIVLHQGQK
ncbi:hypothetical protein E2C01_057032 [Portunus trituberculatus]|uniref:Uncharacterized protein n=1 Tax=Portunus trituberculatus TaxID=210409 RepID=A0A5B7GRY3_PORTR|nr:hypothetical protein [Portunus trituberculatus]